MKTRNTAVTSLHIRANRFDLIGRLADDLAHEIKNPLHAAVINLELLRRRAADGSADARLQRLRLLDGQVGAINERIEWLFQLLRPAFGPAARLDVDRVVAELFPPLERVAALSGVAVRYSPAGAGDGVEIGRTALKHALLNLVVNALDAMRPAGGSLHIQASRAPDEVRLHVTDSGGGVPAEAAARIGEPGYSLCPGHAGLGIAVAHALVEEAGGRVVLEDPGGNGSGATFLLALPRAAGA